MPLVHTSWDDLARLGWPSMHVFKKATEAREHTMESVALNEGWAIDHEWWSYNTLIGLPQLRNRAPETVKHEHTAWSYDNSSNSESFTDEWTETWTRKTSAELIVHAAATIKLSAGITIINVGSTGYELSTTTDSTKTEHKEVHEELTHNWELVVAKNEKLSLVRVITTNIIVEEYDQTYGLAPRSMLGTRGKSWHGQQYVGMDINELLGSPVGTITLRAVGRFVDYSFYLERDGPNGKTIEPLPSPSAANGLAGTSTLEPPVKIIAAASRPSVLAE